MIKIPDYKAGIEGNYWSLVKRHNDGNNGTNTNKGGDWQEPNELPSTKYRNAKTVAKKTFRTSLLGIIQHSFFPCSPSPNPTFSITQRPFFTQKKLPVYQKLR